MMSALSIVLLPALLMGVAGLCLFALWTDFREMRIPNEVPILIAAAWAVRWLVAPSTVDPLLDPLYASGIFAFGLFTFVMLRVGGGDVKLFSALGLWFGGRHVAATLFAVVNPAVAPPLLPLSLYFILLMALCGVPPALGAALVKRQQWALDAIAAFAPRTGRLMAKTTAFPYAAAIVPAALYILWIQAKLWKVFP